MGISLTEEIINNSDTPLTYHEVWEIHSQTEEISPDTVKVYLSKLRSQRRITILDVKRRPPMAERASTQFVSYDYLQQKEHEEHGEPEELQQEVHAS